MLPGCCKNGIVISKIPVMQAGLKEVMRTHFPEYEIISSASAEDLTLLQLRRSGLVIALLFFNLTISGNSLGFHGVTLLVFPGSRIAHVPYGDVIV